MRAGDLSQSGNSDRKWFGLLRRKQAWALTWRAWLLVGLAFLGAGLFAFFGIYPFLAVDAQVRSGVLVVEGWVPEYAITNFVARHPEYSQIITIGGPTTMARGSRDVSDTYASVCHYYLARSGVAPSRLAMVPCFVNRRDRTYSSAVALREWSQTNGVPLHAFDVATMAVHARRSRLLTEKAFPHARVGVVPLLDENYDPKIWWRYSEGVKEILSEAAAYFYARFLFSPH